MPYSLLLVNTFLIIIPFQVFLLFYYYIICVNIIVIWYFKNFLEEFCTEQLSSKRFYGNIFFFCNAIRKTNFIANIALIPLYKLADFLMLENNFFEKKCPLKMSQIWCSRTLGLYSCCHCGRCMWPERLD